MPKASFSKYLNDPSHRAVGLDLTGRFLRFVRIKRRGGSFSVETYGQGPDLSGAIQHGAVADRTLLSKIIRESLAPVRAASAVVVIPERHVFIKTFDIPAAKSSDLSEAIRWEASQYIPFDINDLYLDWQAADQGDGHRVTIVAAPRNIVEDFTLAVEAAGVTTLAVENTSYTCLRAFRALQQAQSTSMLVHLGELESTALLLEQGSPTFSAAVNETTNQLEQVLGSRFSLTPNDAHEARVLLGFSNRRAYGLVRKVMLEELRRLTIRINEIVNFHNEHALTEDPLAQIIVCGPGSETVGFNEVLSQEVHIPASMLPTHPRLQASSHLKKFFSEYQAYVVALSAATRLLQPS